MNFFNCFFTDEKITAFGWTGFAISVPLAIYLMFFVPRLRFPNLAVDKGVGKMIALTCLSLGLIFGELVRVIWRGGCLLP
jgi:hypothetical protein